MFFKNAKLLSRIEELEAELKAFKAVESDLEEEMISFSMDAEGRLVSANNNFYLATGYAAHDISGILLEDLLAPSSKSKLHCQRMLDAVKQGKHWHGALQMIKKNMKLGCAVLFNRKEVKTPSYWDLLFIQQSLLGRLLCLERKRICYLP